MFPRLLMTAVIIAALVVVIKIPKQERQQYLKRYWPVGLGILLLLLALANKVSWIVPLISFGFIVFQYVLKLLPAFNAHAREQSRGSNTSNSSSINHAMNLLGFKEKPRNRQVVIDRHRQLIAKHHPDKGGDPKIASNINHARDVLLGLFD